MGVPITALVPVVVDLVKGVLSKVMEKDKVDEIAKDLPEAIELELKENEDFRRFVLAYEGTFSELPRSIGIIRALVRPTVTWAFVVAIIYGTIVGQLPWEFIGGIGSTIFAFWFKERSDRRNLEGGK